MKIRTIFSCAFCGEQSETMREVEEGEAFSHFTPLPEGWARVSYLSARSSMKGKTLTTLGCSLFHALAAIKAVHGKVIPGGGDPK
jgi:hypothetical protein